MSLSIALPVRVKQFSSTEGKKSKTILFQLKNQNTFQTRSMSLRMTGQSLFFFFSFFFSNKVNKYKKSSHKQPSKYNQKPVGQSLPVQVDGTRNQTLLLLPWCRVQMAAVMRNGVCTANVVADSIPSQSELNTTLFRIQNLST